MSRSGARQWRHRCDCHPEVAEERHSQHWERMHSEVSYNNKAYFISENRVGEDVTEADLKQLLEELESGESLLCCNCCGALRVVGG